MDNCIICVIKDPGEQPIVANIPATMEALQKAVGGHIEAVNIASDLTLLLSTEGLLLGLPVRSGGEQLHLLLRRVQLLGTGAEDSRPLLKEGHRLLQGGVPLLQQGHDLLQTGHGLFKGQFFLGGHFITSFSYAAQV